MQLKPSRAQISVLKDAAKHGCLHRARGRWVPDKIITWEQMLSSDCHAHHLRAVQSCRVRGWLARVGDGKSLWPPVAITEVGRKVLTEAEG